MGRYLTRTQRFGWLLGPATLAGSWLAWVIADRALVIGPFDRAQITLFLAVPLLLVSPGATAIGLGERSRGVKAGIAAALGIVVTIVITIALDLGTTQIACVPVTPPFEPLLMSALVGASAGAGYALSVGAAIAESRRGRRSSLVAGGLTLALAAILTFVVFFAEFPVLACATP